MSLKVFEIYLSWMNDVYHTNLKRKFEHSFLNMRFWFSKFLLWCRDNQLCIKYCCTINSVDNCQSSLQLNLIIVVTCINTRQVFDCFWKIVYIFSLSSNAFIIENKQWFQSRRNVTFRCATSMRFSSFKLKNQKDNRLMQSKGMMEWIFKIQTLVIESERMQTWY